MPSTVTAGSVGKFFDADGDKYLVKLTGKGSVEVTLDDPDSDGRGAIDALTFTGTNSKSTLAVTLLKRGPVGADGEIAIGGITGLDKLGSLVAAKSDLTGAGLNFSNRIGSLTLDDVLNGADLTLGGPATKVTTLKLGKIGAGSDITSAARLAVTAAEAGAGVWTAPSASAIKVRGDFAASLALTASTAELGNRLALDSFAVIGGDFTGDLNVLGFVGTVSVQRKNGAGGSVVGANIAATRIQTLSIARDVSGSVILAGANLGADFAVSADDSYEPGRIRTLTIGGNVTSSVIGAGLFTGNAIFNDGDDGLIGTLTSSSVAVFSIKGTASADSFFAARTFPEKVKIGGVNVRPPTDVRFLTTGSADIRAPLLSAGLSADTGDSATDAITFDSTISGRLTDNGGAPKLFAAFGANPFTEIPGVVGADGRFVLNINRLTTLNGGPLADGAYTLNLQGRDAAGNNTATFAVNFQLDTTAPPAPTFNLSTGSDTGVVGDQLTSAAVVQITGAAEPNVTVTLGARTALAAANGTFLFPDVPLTTGDNLFTARVTDVAGNVGQTSRTFTRSGTFGTDVVLEWNQTNLEAIRLGAASPPIATRGLAMTSGAMFDVVAAFEAGAGFFSTRTAPAGATLEAAVASAAHDVLVYLFPGQQALFDATLATSLGRVPDGAGETSGVAFGAEIADTVIAIRSQDGFNTYVDYAPGGEVGDWQQTAPMFEVGLLPNWPLVDPFVMNTGDQFRPDAPPALDSAEYAAAFNEVKMFGAATGSARDAQQTQIARFWADGSGTYTPAGHWNQIAMERAFANGLSTSASARLLAQLNTALADAAIVSWDAKYSYNTWRPITAIHGAALDGNAQTSPDAAWESLLITPPFPEYTSGHSTFSGAASAVLTAVFGENVAFSTGSLGLPGVTRNFDNFEDAAEEAGQSRIYGGIHFQFANQAGLESGRELAEFVLDRFAADGDFAAPTLVLEAPANGLVTGANFTLTGRVFDNISGVASLSAQLDNAAAVPVTFAVDGSFSIPVTLPADGAHTLTLLAADAAGNIATPHVFSFTADTLTPTLELDPALEGATLAFGSLLVGTGDGTGSPLRSLTYSFDGGAAIPVGFDAATGTFNQALDLSALAAGAHALAITATDSAGLTTTTTANVNLNVRIPFTVLGGTPMDTAEEIGTTFRPQFFFSRPVDPATLNANNFFATGPDGAKLAATIVPGGGGDFAWLFFADPMPGGAQITIHVDGATILAAADASPLDADGDSVPGGVRETTFRTVSLAPLTGTSLSGRVFDPGADLKPMTFDDVRAGADGVLHTADDVFLNPLAGVKVFIIGLESQAVFTDATGAFNFPSAPAGNVKLAIDGHTATNAPAGFFFPEMVMDLNLRAGAANTSMGSMGTLDQQAANSDRGEVYLPRLRSTILQSVSGGANTMVGVDALSAPNLTAEQRALLTLEVQPGSLLDENGAPVANPMVGLSTVPEALVREMLPPGVLQHTFDITIQAPGAAVFDTPLEITFPNVFNAAPGTKLNFLSFDHTTGRLVIEGTATVSADGLSATTDPGTGITKPGWHGLTPPGLCVGSGGAPLMPPPEAGPMDTVTEHLPQPLSMIYGESGSVFSRMWSGPNPVPGAPEPRMQPGCNIPQRPPPGMMTQPFLNVTIEVDGPLASFMKKPGDLTGGLDLISQSFTLIAGDGGPVIFATAPKTYDEMFNASTGFANGFSDLLRDQLYGSKIKITEILQKPNGTRSYDIYTFYQYRWVDVVDAPHAEARNGGTAAFHKTLATSLAERPKIIDIHLPASVQTTFSLPVGGPEEGEHFNFGGPVSGEGTTLWRYSPVPASDGEEAGAALIEVGNVLVGGVLATATAIQPAIIDLNETGFVQELIRVLRALRATPGPDGTPGTADDVVFYPRADGNQVTASEQFKLAFPGFLPANRQPGTDGVLFNDDDTFSGGTLGLRALEEFGRLEVAVRNDFNAVQANLPVAFTIGDPDPDDDLDPDVTINWKDLAPGVSGETPVLDLNPMFEPLIKSEKIGAAAKEWALAEYLNVSPDLDKADVSISYAIQFASNITLAQKIANTASHEIAHTFGINEAYFKPEGAAFARDVFPMGDLMNTARNEDGNKVFTKSHATLLQAAMGLHRDGDLPLTDALTLYRENFYLPRSLQHLQDESDPNFRPPELAVLSDNALILPGGTVSLAEKVAADGAGGALVTRDFVLTNPGLAPVTINSATLGAVSAFALVNNIVGMVLDPGEEVTLTVRFDPQGAGSFTDTLTLTSNATTAPFYSIQLGGDAIPLAPTAALTLANNNLGGVALAGGTNQRPQLATITNSGSQPLLLSSFAFGEGADAFSLLGLPPDLATNPISLATGESFTFGLAFDPAQLGLQRAIIEIGTNDPASPSLNVGAVGTGLGSVVYPAWGDDFVAIQSNSTIRTVSDAAGHFEVFLPARADYEAVVFDPVTGLVSHNFGGTPESGRGLDLTARLVFAASTAPDTDFDGLPDDIEFAIGTGRGLADTDSDGVSDFAEVLRGIDPLGGRALPVGVVSAVAMAGEAKEVVAAVLASDPVRQFAFVATGAAGLAIVDVSDVSKPVLVGQLDLPGDATDVAVDPLLGVAVVAANTGGVHFIDVSDPTQPNLLRTVSANANQVEIGGGLAFITDGTRLRSYDVISGDQRQSFNTGATTLTGLALDGMSLFSMESTNTLRAFDVTGGVISAHDTLSMPVGSGKLFAGGGVAYVGGTLSIGGGFATADVSNLDDLALLSSVDNNALGGTAFASNGSRFGVTVGHTDVGPAAFRALDVVDVSDPANTANFVTRINLPQRPLGVALGSSFALVADGSAGLQVVNFLSPDVAATPPTVSLLTPGIDIDAGTPGIQVVEGTAIPMRVEAMDDVSVTRVDLLINGVPVVSDVSFPFDFATIAPLVAGGTNLTLQARATDLAGSVALSAPIDVQLVADTFAPALVAQNPPDGTARTQSFQNVVLTFSEPMDATDFTANSIHVTGPGGEVPPTAVDVRPGGREVRVSYPVLVVGAYTLTLDRNEISDIAGNLLGPAATNTTFDIVNPTVTWINPAGGDFHNPANWSTNVVPSSGDDVFIGLDDDFVVTINGPSVVVNRLYVDESLTIFTPLTVTSGPLNLRHPVELNATLGANVVNHSVFTSAGVGGVINGTFTNAADGILRVSSGFGAILTLNGNVTNAGLIEMNEDAVGIIGGTQIFLNAASTLTNTGIFRVQGVGGARTFNGAFTNLGVIDVLENLTLTRGAGSVFATTAGTISIAAARTFTINGGTTMMASGTTLLGTGGTGALTFGGTQTLNLASDVTVRDVIITLGGSVTRTGPGNFIAV